MTTKEKILAEALSLFAEKSYSDVYVGDIAAAVGIKAPSLYKHFKSKQDIFSAILQQLTQAYEQQAAALQLSSGNAAQDGAYFSGAAEDVLISSGKALFAYFLHDDTVKKFRKMLTLEQFHNAELAALFSRQYIDDPLRYQASVLAVVTANGLLAAEDADVAALHFYAPIYLLLTMCDRQPEREEEALRLLERHIRQFNRIYRGGTAA